MSIEDKNTTLNCKNIMQSSRIKYHNECLLQPLARIKNLKCTHTNKSVFNKKSSEKK